MAPQTGSSACDTPIYSTNHYIADHALLMLPAGERHWLDQRHKHYLLGTTSPEDPQLSTTCALPANNHASQHEKHSVEWAWDYSDFKVVNGEKKDRTAVLAQQAYDNAVTAYRADKLDDAAFFLGAMAHYIGDVSYANIHSDTVWTDARSPALSPFEQYVSPDRLVKRQPYSAVKRVSKNSQEIYRTFGSAQDKAAPPAIGKSVNLGANELADVLHTFYVSVVKH